MIRGAQSPSNTPPSRGGVHHLTSSSVYLRQSNVLAAGTLGALTALERDGLSFAEVVEARSSARRVVEEVLIPVVGQDETEAFVTDEPLDRAVHGCCHTELLEM